MPDIILQPFASQGDVATVPQADPQGFVNFQEGYTRYYEISLSSGDPQAKAVERHAQNYLFRMITENLQAWQQMSMSPWYSNMPGGYQKDAQIVYRTAGGQPWKVYRSTKDANISVPGANADWEYQQTSGEMLANIARPMGGPTGPTGAPISAAIEFNDYINSGTWYIGTDAVAATCTNAPVAFDQTQARAGVLEAFRWGTGLVFQSYLDYRGRQFTRGRTNGGVWGPWIETPSMAGIQGALHTYAADTSVTVNTVTAAFKPALTRADGTLIVVRIKNTNTGAATINDGIDSRSIVGGFGQPLIGGELVANRNALLMYSTVTGSYMLVSSHAGAQQVATGSYLYGDPAADDNTNKLISSRWARANTVSFRGQMSGSPDLNNFTGRGMYVCAYSVITSPVNFPVANSGVLIVGSLSGADSPLQTNYVTQEYHTVTNRVFRRALNTGAWTSWIELAKVDSQAFTGTPTVPDPAVRDDSQQIPSTKWVRANTLAIRGALGAAENLDTFFEPGIYWQATNAGASGGTGYPAGLAGALEVIREGDGGATPNKVYQRYTSYGSAAGTTPRLYIRGYYNSGTPGWSPWYEIARLESPAFTGNPTAPTPAQYDNDTSLATTAHVQRASGNVRSVSQFGTSQVLTDINVGTAFTFTGSVDSTATLPGASILAGSTVWFSNHSRTNSLTVVCAGTDTIANHIGGGGTITSVVLLPGETLAIAVRTAGQWSMIAGSVLTRLAPPTTSRTGEIAMVAANSVPVGAMKANGQAISRTTYAALFAKIGTTFGAGDGSTTFGIPDLRGEFVRGWDDGRGADPGRGMGTWQDSGNRWHGHGAWSDPVGDHTHGAWTDSQGWHDHGIKGGDTQINTSGPSTVDGHSLQSVRHNTEANGSHGHNIGMNGAGYHAHGVGVSGDGLGEARPRNVSMLAVIFYQ